jgi:hypothetical protein
MSKMPIVRLRAMRFVVERMLATLQQWEDQHANVADYRFSELNTGLWQASQSMKAIITGDFRPLRERARQVEVLPVSVGASYADELLSGIPRQRELRVVD